MEPVEQLISAWIKCQSFVIFMIEKNTHAYTSMRKAEQPPCMLPPPFTISTQVIHVSQSCKTDVYNSPSSTVIVYTTKLSFRWGSITLLLIVTSASVNRLRIEAAKLLGRPFKKSLGIFLRWALISSEPLPTIALDMSVKRNFELPGTAGR